MPGFSSLKLREQKKISLIYASLSCRGSHCHISSHPDFKVCRKWRLVPQLGLSICCQDHLAYLVVVVASASPQPWGAADGATEHFLLCSISFLFLCPFSCPIPASWFLTLFPYFYLQNMVSVLLPWLFLVHRVKWRKLLLGHFILSPCITNLFTFLLMPLPLVSYLRPSSLKIFLYFFLPRVL